MGEQDEFILTLLISILSQFSSTIKVRTLRLLLTFTMLDSDKSRHWQATEKIGSVQASPTIVQK